MQFRVFQRQLLECDVAMLFGKVGTNISEEPADSVFRVEESCTLDLEVKPLKCYYPLAKLQYRMPEHCSPHIHYHENIISLILLMI
jgi:hypothetical protein